MTVDSDEFRAVLRHFPSGVTIVTIQAEGERHGLTVSAFASISPTPPLIMVAIDHKHRSEELLQKPGASFGVNILAADQQDLSNRFASFKGDRFAEGDWVTATTGAPILKNALAWLDCTIHAHYPAGTHTIYVGEVRDCSVPRSDESPLVYWNRSYRDLAVPETASE